MLCVVNEETDRVIAERRMATLRDLGSDPSGVRTEAETLTFACTQLDRNHHDLPFTLTYLFHDDGSADLAGTTGIAADSPIARMPGSVWPAATLADGESALVSLHGEQFAELPSGASEAATARLLDSRGTRSSDPTVRLVFAGDPRRGIAPCASCHGLAGLKRAAPALAGQQASYVERQLVSFQQRTRANDEGEQMRVIAAQLTSDEIRNLSQMLAAPTEQRP